MTIRGGDRLGPIQLHAIILPSVTESHIPEVPIPSHCCVHFAFKVRHQDLGVVAGIPTHPVWHWTILTDIITLVHSSCVDDHLWTI